MKCSQWKCAAACTQYFEQYWTSWFYMINQTSFVKAIENVPSRHALCHLRYVCNEINEWIFFFKLRFSTFRTSLFNAFVTLPFIRTCSFLPILHIPTQTIQSYNHHAPSCWNFSVIQSSDSDRQWALMPTGEIVHKGLTLMSVKWSLSLTFNTAFVPLSR